jgi:hypothetical protein
MSQPNFNETQSDKIHPALDFIADHAYIGQVLPCGEPDRDQKNMLYLIRDDRVTIPCKEDTLEQNGISLLFTDFILEPRWSLDGIRKFIQGEEAVEPSRLFDKIKELFKTYIELPNGRLYDFLTLWSIGTYFFPLFNSYPYVYVGGIRESGKTKLLTLCQCIGFNSIFSGNMSTACVYRLIQNGRCSLFIDETEKLSTRYKAQEFRNILLSGYKKGQKTYRNRKTLEGNFVPEPFEVYGPKMLANIEGLEDVLKSRCITITMQRGLNGEVTNREVNISDSTWQQVRDMVYPFLMKNWKGIRQTYYELENDIGLLNRDWELWKPIITLAKFFNNDDNGLYEKMKGLAVDKIAESQRDNLDSHEIILVEALLSAVDEDGFYKLSNIKKLMADRFDYGEWINERYVGKLLRRLGFTNKRRVGIGTEYFLSVSGVRDCARRLGVDVVSEVSECGEGTGEQGTQTVHDIVEVVEVKECQKEE